ncbi:CDP-diacylglycerol---serine O-phosphatidyltransferase [Candidatus Magnetomoraceae bacterium gMMP-15]
MQKKQIIPRQITAILVFGRPPMIFMGMVCAIAVIITQNPIYYMLGVLCLIISLTFDLVDGWFASRFAPHYKLAHLADRMMNKIIYSIIFPVVAVGMMWRFHFISPTNSRSELLHVVFVLLLCVTVLIRESFAHFMRNFALRKGHEEEMAEINRLRTVVAAPVALILYAYAFYVPEGPASFLYSWISWSGNIHLRILFFVEIIFFIINFGSIARYCRRYGSYCLDELCMDDETLRRRILSIFPNTLTMMNAMMGILSVFFAYNERMREAYLILIGAAIFDRLDGAIARKLGLTEPLPDTSKKRRATFGGILDDIADGISFCIAPALIFYFLFENCPVESIQKSLSGWIALFYGLMGIGRLIYFTLDRNPIPGFFKGMPSPGAALFVATPFIMFQQAIQANEIIMIEFWGMFSFILMIIVSVLMNIYPIHYLHLGRFAGRHPLFTRIVFLLMFLFIFTPYFGHFVFILGLIYTFSPIFTKKIKPEVAARETRNKTIKKT